MEELTDKEYLYWKKNELNKKRTQIINSILIFILSLFFGIIIVFFNKTKSVFLEYLFFVISSYYLTRIVRKINYKISYDVYLDSVKKTNQALRNYNYGDGHYYDDEQYFSLRKGFFHYLNGGYIENDIDGPNKVRGIMIEYPYMNNELCFTTIRLDGFNAFYIRNLGGLIDGKYYKASPNVHSEIHSLYENSMLINNNLSQNKIDKIRTLLINSSKLLNKTEIVNTWDDRNGKCKFWIKTSNNLHFAEVSIAELEESIWFDLYMESISVKEYINI
jgi:hypothetical protein